MAERKTHKNDGDVDVFLASVEDDRRRRDAMAVNAMTEGSAAEILHWSDFMRATGSDLYLAAVGYKV